MGDGVNDSKTGFTLSKRNVALGAAEDGEHGKLREHKWIVLVKFNRAEEHTVESARE